MIDREPFASPAETCHHFINDHHNIVFVAKRPYPLHVPIGWDDDPVRTCHSFHQYSGDGLRAFVLNDLFQVIEIILCEIFLRDIGIMAVKC